jgi:hypothetical protein
MSDETGIPLKELADTLASKKYHIGPGVKDNIQADNRRMGAASLMNMWKEGMGMEIEGQENPFDNGNGGVNIQEPGDRTEKKQKGVV